MGINSPTKSLQEKEADQDPRDKENMPEHQINNTLLQNWLKKY